MSIEIIFGEELTLSAKAKRMLDFLSVNLNSMGLEHKEHEEVTLLLNQIRYQLSLAVGCDSDDLTSILFFLDKNDNVQIINNCTIEDAQALHKKAGEVLEERRKLMADSDETPQGD